MNRPISPLHGPERFEDRLTPALGLSFNVHVSLPLVEIHAEATMAVGSGVSLAVEAALPLVQVEASVAIAPEQPLLQIEILAEEPPLTVEVGVTPPVVVLPPEAELPVVEPTVPELPPIEPPANPQAVEPPATQGPSAPVVPSSAEPPMVAPPDQPAAPPIPLREVLPSSGPRSIPLVLPDSGGGDEAISTPAEAVVDPTLLEDDSIPTPTGDNLPDPQILWCAAVEDYFFLKFGSAGTTAGAAASWAEPSSEALPPMGTIELMPEPTEPAVVEEREVVFSHAAEDEAEAREVLLWLMSLVASGAAGAVWASRQSKGAAVDSGTAEAFDLAFPLL